MAKKPVVLIIRDGWGINPGGKAKAQENGDATLLAHTPFHDHLYATYPRGTVSASGEDVGLPEGQMGNSEVGHLNLGAGRVVYQDLTRINKSIRDGELAQMPVLQEAFARCASGSQVPPEVLPVLFSTDQTPSLVAAKERLKEQGYPLEESAAWVTAHYRSESYAGLAGKNPVWLITPSTTGINTLPLELARRLQQDFGGEIVTEENYAVMLGEHEAKHRRGYLNKVEHPGRVEIKHHALSALLAGRHVVLVDDVFTSGETSEALERALAEHGVRPLAVAVLGATRGGEPALNTQIVELAKILAPHTGEKWTLIDREIRIAHARSRASLLKTAIQEAAHEPDRIRSAIRNRAQLVRPALGAGTPAPAQTGGDALVPSDGAGVGRGVPALSHLHPAEGGAAAQPAAPGGGETARRPRLHLIGLVSDGGVHSHQDHLTALCDAAKAAGVEDILVHAITDGRDTSPTGGAGCLAKLETDLKPSGAKIATIIGRYYAMDRDKRWDRNKLAWDAIVLGRGEQRTDTPRSAIQAAYERDPRGDEFLLPMIFSNANEQRVQDGDVILWFNFRADRARQLSNAFLKSGFDGFDREVTPKVGYYTLTEYDITYYDLGCRVVFAPESLHNNLGQIVAAAGLTQLRAAESEKYPHVTFFFNSGIEEPNANEDRYLAVSPKEVTTYDKKPQMSAPDLTFEVLRRLESYDLVIMNYANPDMVGHTGVVEAGIHACETIDLAVRLIVEKVLELGGKLFITADHGNCELMRNPDGSPNTAHTTNLVHGIYVAADAAGFTVQDGRLADVAPTLLDMLGVRQPTEMTGVTLLTRKPRSA